MKRCLVLGGGGFIGSAVSDALLRAGHFVRIFARPSTVPYRHFHEQENVEWFCGDFLNIDDIKRAIGNIEVIIHLISTTVPQNAHEQPWFDIESNLYGTMTLLEAIKEVSIQKIIFFSSGGAVYGEPERLPIDEKHPTNPKSTYGITKLTIEKHLQVFAETHKIALHILRVSNPYGYRQNLRKNQGIIGIALQRAVENKPIEIWGNGECLRDFIHINDVAEACCLMVNYEGKAILFNLGSGKGCTIQALLDNIDLRLKTKINRIYHPKRTFDAHTNILDISRIQNELHWKPKISLNAGIQQLIDYHAKNKEETCKKTFQ